MSRAERSPFDRHRYLGAAIVAGLLTGSGLAYGSYIRAGFDRDLRQRFREAKAQGLPEMANVNVETMQLSDFGVELNRRSIRKFQFASLIQGGWFIWVPCTWALCFGLTYFWSRSLKSADRVQLTEGRPSVSEAERTRLYLSARDALHAAQELFEKNPQPGSPEWERWLELLQKGREANDAYLKIAAIAGRT